MYRYLGLSIVALCVCLHLPSFTRAAPTVATGFTIQKYVDVSQPGDIDLDVFGNLYVGTGSLGFTPVRIRKVLPDRSITEIGDPIADPDIVIVDDQGDVVAPGNVIVGADDKFVEVDPNSGTTTVRYTGIPDHNVLDMDFDSTGRLFAAQARGSITVIENNSLQTFDDYPGRQIHAVAVDESDQLYAAFRDTSEIFRFDPNSAGPPTFFTSFPGTLRKLAYTSVPGPFAFTFYLGTLEGDIYTIDPNSGSASLFAQGFDRVDGIAFGPGGTMFVSDAGAEAVYQIGVPEPATLGIFVLGVSIVFLRGRLS